MANPPPPSNIIPPCRWSSLPAESRHMQANEYFRTIHVELLVKSCLPRRFRWTRKRFFDAPRKYTALGRYIRNANHNLKMDFACFCHEWIVLFKFFLAMLTLLFFLLSICAKRHRPPRMGHRLAKWIRSSLLLEMTKMLFTANRQLYMWVFSPDGEKRCDFMTSNRHIPDSLKACICCNQRRLCE